MKKLFLNSCLCHGIGLCLITYLLFLIAPHVSDNAINSIIITILTYLSCSITLPKITKYLLVERTYYILPVLFSACGIALLIIIIFRIDYSLSILLKGLFLSYLWLYLSSIFRRNAKRLKLTAIPNFDLRELVENKRLEITILSEPYLFKNIKDGIVVDLHRNLTATQEKFIADCSINNIHVFHFEGIKENLEGKVQTKHLSENSIGTLLSPPLYVFFKRIWESLLILITFPITLPIMIFTAICIKIETPGPAMFIQKRIGQGGKEFYIYKFRSMMVCKSQEESKFATAEQARVTRVGKFIRKVRIDELPQFFNVLKGNMALIGPRPEQNSFVKNFEKEIPFYGYRHMVKPGITGWAQTVQGYTDDTDSTREKLAHDLYYIKHLCFWLDANIVLKTIKTMLTGFGAK